MKKILGGKMYNTETATLLAEAGYGIPGDFHHYEEELYQKKTGEFFLYGYGGAMSAYSKPCGDGSVSGGEDIVPLTKADARAWAEENCNADTYEAIFGVVEE